MANFTGEHMAKIEGGKFALPSAFIEVAKANGDRLYYIRSKESHTVIVSHIKDELTSQPIGRTKPALLRTDPNGLINAKIHDAFRNVASLKLIGLGDSFEIKTPEQYQKDSDDPWLSEQQNQNPDFDLLSILPHKHPK